VSWAWPEVALGFALVDWLFIIVDKQKWRALTKPFVILALLAGFSLADGWLGRTHWFGLGLLFCLLGDILMLMPPRFFIPAVAAFLTGFGFYSFGFIQGTPVSRGSLTYTITGAVLIAVIDYFGFGQLQRGLLKRPGQRWFRIPLFIYQMGISLMVISALYSLQDPNVSPLAGWLFLPGAILLFVSDGLLAYNRFVRPIPRGRLIATIPYHLGQIALITGVMLRG